MEATCGWYRAVDVLQRAGASVHPGPSARGEGFTYRRVKDDVQDAAGLADPVRRQLRRDALAKLLAEMQQANGRYQPS